MTTNSNPFADEPLQPAQRLQSAADPLNPYAAPVAAEPGKRPEVVGTWRDGSLLVMHRRATLPELCIVTGAPTKQRHWQTLRWHQPVDWENRALIVEFGIDPQVLRANTKYPRIPMACAAVIWLTMLPGTIAYIYVNRLHGAAAEDALGSAMAVGIVLTILSFLPTLIFQQRRQWLHLAHVEKHYVWLRGPSEAFLQTLPPWSDMNGTS